MVSDEFPSSRVIQQEGEMLKEAEIGVVTESGSTIWTEVAARSLPFPDWKAYILTSDITKRKLSEEALKASEKNYRELIDNSLVGIFKSNLQGEILFANELVPDTDNDVNGIPPIIPPPTILLNTPFPVTVKALAPFNVFPNVIVVPVSSASPVKVDAPV